MNIYIAGRVSRCEELNGYADQLSKLGHFITARWLATCQDAPHANRSDMPLEQRGRYAMRDFADIIAADLLILFTEQPGNSGFGNARLVEYGVAISRGSECWAVGPQENLFVCLPTTARFETWGHCYEYAQRRQTEETRLRSTAQIPTTTASRSPATGRAIHDVDVPGDVL